MTGLVLSAPGTNMTRLRYAELSGLQFVLKEVNISSMLVIGPTSPSPPVRDLLTGKLSKPADPPAASPPASLPALQALNENGSLSWMGLPRPSPPPEPAIAVAHTPPPAQAPTLPTTPPEQAAYIVDVFADQANAGAWLADSGPVGHWSRQVLDAAKTFVSSGGQGPAVAQKIDAAIQSTPPPTANVHRDVKKVAPIFTAMLSSMRAAVQQVPAVTDKPPAAAAGGTIFGFPKWVAVCAAGATALVLAGIVTALTFGRGPK